MEGPAEHSRTSPRRSGSKVGGPQGVGAPGVGATVAVHQERINKLEGEFKGLRAQFTEFWRKSQRGGGGGDAETPGLHEEVQRLRAEVEGSRAATQRLQQVQQELQQLRGELVGARSAAQQTQQLQQSLDALRRQVDALAPSSAQAQAGLQQELLRVQGQVEPLAQQVQGLRATQQEQAQGLQGLRQEQALLRHKSDDISQAVQLLQGRSQEMSQALQSMQECQQQGFEAKREADKLRQEHGALDGKIQGVQQQAAEARRLLDQLRQEVSSVKSETQGARGYQREQQHHMRMLEEKTRGLDELGRLRATVDTNSFEFWSLKKKLYDSGVLAPPPPPPEPDKTPVGTLELGEDVFTARLLIRLGLMKAAGDAAREMAERMGMEDGSMSDASSDAGSAEPLNRVGGLVENCEEQVTGIQVPEIDESGRGRLFATSGWVLVCTLTLAMQVLVVSLMIKYGMEAGDDCLDEPLPTQKWYMLHVSKSLAIIVAGVLMCKELMDIVNYQMVSQLLMSKTSIEVSAFAFLRLLLIFWIAMANVVIFMTMTSPADVWINMTALGFIGELSESVLNVGRRGVFGHHISKAVGSVNFSLNFMTDYPWWFAYARGCALAVAGSFIAIFAALLWILPDNVCKESGESPLRDLLSFGR